MVDWSSACVLHCLSPLNITLTNYQKQSTCKKKRLTRRKASTSEASTAQDQLTLCFGSMVRAAGMNGRKSHFLSQARRPRKTEMGSHHHLGGRALSVPKTPSLWVWCAHLCAFRHVHRWRQRLVSASYSIILHFICLFIYFKLPLLKGYFLLNCVYACLCMCYVYIWVCAHEYGTHRCQKRAHISI